MPKIDLDAIDQVNRTGYPSPFDREVPSTENIARDIWRRLEPQLKDENHRLHSVRVYETPDLYVDYFGEQPCSG